MEIERKFLIFDITEIKEHLIEYKHKYIVQNYLYKDMFTAIRKRLIIEDGKGTYIYTIKTNKTGYSVNEIEQQITQEEYYNIKNNPNNTEICKTRYIIPYKNYKIELDIFEGEYKDLIFAEVEFLNEKEAFEFDKIIPDWFGIEISNYITNSDMATMSRDEVFKKIRKIEDIN